MTMAMDNQYWSERKMPVRSHSSSIAATATTARSVRSVYSGILVRHDAAQHVDDDLVDEKSADGDHQEEHEFLQRHDPEHHPGRVLGAVAPVDTNDPEQ